MKDSEVLRNINLALNEFFKNEDWLIKHDINEKTMTQRLSLYLNDLFPQYSVDCEYNGNISGIKGRKRVTHLAEDLYKAGLLHKSEVYEEHSYIERSVYPDIIIHIRGTNESNLCIVEVKKSSSNISDVYDHMKLVAYTSHSRGNDLGYQIGIFLRINLGEGAPYKSIIFKNGETVEGMRVEN